jgi:hypothetical protein
MKSDLVHSKVQLEKDILDRLVTEVHETIATDVRFAKTKKNPAFGVVNLWNIRRNGRSARRAIRQPHIITGLAY